MEAFKLESGSIPAGCETIAFDVHEQLGRPFRVEAWVSARASAGAALDPAEAVGSRAKLVVTLPNNLPMEFVGQISAMSLLRSQEGESGTVSSLYRVQLAPRLQTLAMTKRSRVFTRKTLQEIVAEVLEVHGLAEGEDFVFQLADPPPTEEHVSQYKESDLDFLHRWMEREGWTYFFDTRSGTDKLVIVDHRAGHEASRPSPVRYVPQAEGDATARDSLRELARKTRATAGTVRVTDYDYTNPQTAIRGESTVSSRGVSGEISMYGARVFTPDAAARLARIRAEEVRAGSTTYMAVGAAAHVRPGFTFEVFDHPRASMNRALLATRVRHTGVSPSATGSWGDTLAAQLGTLAAQREIYRVELGAIPADTQFRNVSTTSWPRLDGFENAVVDGAAASPYAQIDDQGRYALKFKYDDSVLRDGNASTRVRMAQPHGGALEGFHMPLRKGTEVACAFLGGDPDRPVIVSVLPNQATPSKVVSGNRSQNIIQTGSGNWICMEDQQGAEWISVFSPAGGSTCNLYLGSPRGGGGFALTSQCCPEAPATGPHAKDEGPFSAQLYTTGDVQVTSGCSLNVVAGQDIQIRAQGGDYETFSSADWFLDVDGPATETYGGKLDYDVTGATTLDFKNTLDVHVEGSAKFEHHATLSEVVTGTVTQHYNTLKRHKVDASDLRIVVGARTYERLIHKATVKGGDVQFVNGNQDLTANLGLTTTVHGPKTETTLGGAEINTTADFTWELPGKTFRADYESSFSSKVSGIKVGIVLGARRSSSLHGIQIDGFQGGRFSLALSDSLELANTKLGTSLAGDVSTIGGRIVANGISMSFGGTATDNIAQQYELIALIVHVNALSSQN